MSAFLNGQDPRPPSLRELLAQQTEVEIETVAHRLADMPLLFNWVEGGKTPPISYQRL